MLEEIGTTAGEIRYYLEKHDEATVGRLTQELKKTERMVLLGIGWLAHEGKLKTEGTLTLSNTGLHGYTLRVLPFHEDLQSNYELGLIAWV